MVFLSLEDYHGTCKPGLYPVFQSGLAVGTFTTILEDYQGLVVSESETVFHQSGRRFGPRFSLPVTDASGIPSAGGGSIAPFVAMPGAPIVASCS